MDIHGQSGSLSLGIFFSELHNFTLTRTYFYICKRIKTRQEYSKLTFMHQIICSHITVKMI